MLTIFIGKRVDSLKDDFNFLLLFKLLTTLYLSVLHLSVRPLLPFYMVHWPENTQKAEHDSNKVQIFPIYTCKAIPEQREHKKAVWLYKSL